MRLIQVGLGLWGLNWATSVLPTVQNAEPVAFVDGSAEVRERAQAAGLPEDRLFPDLASALNKYPADALLGTVPLSGHAALCLEGLAHDLHVLVEKPFADNVGEASRLVQAAQSAGRILAVNQNYRYFGHAQAARDLIAGGRLGKPQALRVTFARLYDETYRYFFLAQPLLSDMAIHHFDLMRFILNDDPVSVSCETWGEDGMPFSGPPAASVVIRFGQGTVVQYFGSWIARGPNTTYGAHWALDAAHGHAAWTFRGDDDQGDGMNFFDIYQPDQATSSVPVPDLVHSDRAGVLDAFARLVDHGEADRSLSMGSDNLKSLAIMDAAIESARCRGDIVQLT